MKTDAEILEEHKKKYLIRYKNGQLVFISLFTSVLALFIIIISFVDLEEKDNELAYQKLVGSAYHDVIQYKNENNLYWLTVENTVTKGVRLTFSIELLAREKLFSSARAKINPSFLPYLNKLVALIKSLDLETFPLRKEKMTAKILQADQQMIMTIMVEGHTDSYKLAKTALYQSNLELSSFRAYALMNFIKLYSSLPAQHFSVAGYGTFKPISKETKDAINRRVEIYIVPHILKKISHVL